MSGDCDSDRRAGMQVSSDPLPDGRPRSAAVIVAHPDDETLWAGGYILSHDDCHWFIAALCRAGDPDRAPKFRRALERLGARGAIADLDDGPEQRPLDGALVRETVLSLLPTRVFDLILTHGPGGEYTRHLRHEETSGAVLSLWRSGELRAGSLWRFAYEDGRGSYLPRVVEVADLRFPLSPTLWLQKQRVITEIYGFAPNSWEVRTTPKEEGFQATSARPSGARAGGH